MYLGVLCSNMDVSPDARSTDVERRGKDAESMEFSLLGVDGCSIDPEAFRGSFSTVSRVSDWCAPANS